jgi:hypothetical protein
LHGSFDLEWELIGNKAVADAVTICYKGHFYVALNPKATSYFCANLTKYQATPVFATISAAIASSYTEKRYEVTNCPLPLSIMGGSVNS